MVSNKFKSEDISKFLNSWDRKISNLNIEVRKVNQKQKKERATLKKREGYTFRLQNQFYKKYW